jgi:dephospho-CoA kinase
MAKIIIGIGVPGSGKTTALKPFAERNTYTYISPDDIRAELTGNAAD